MYNNPIHIFAEEQKFSIGYLNYGWNVFMIFLSCLGITINLYFGITYVKRIFEINKLENKNKVNVSLIEKILCIVSFVETFISIGWLINSVFMYHSFKENEHNYSHCQKLGLFEAFFYLLDWMILSFSLYQIKQMVLNPLNLLRPSLFLTKYFLSFAGISALFMVLLLFTDIAGTSPMITCFIDLSKIKNGKLKLVKNLMFLIFFTSPILLFGFGFHQIFIMSKSNNYKNVKQNKKFFMKYFAYILIYILMAFLLITLYMINYIVGIKEPTKGMKLYIQIVTILSCSTPLFVGIFRLIKTNLIRKLKCRSIVNDDININLIESNNNNNIENFNDFEQNLLRKIVIKYFIGISFILGKSKYSCAEEEENNEDINDKNFDSKDNNNNKDIKNNEDKKNEGKDKINEETGKNIDENIIEIIKENDTQISKDKIENEDDIIKNKNENINLKSKNEIINDNKDLATEEKDKKKEDKSNNNTNENSEETEQNEKEKKEDNDNININPNQEIIKEDNNEIKDNKIENIKKEDENENKFQNIITLKINDENPQDNLIINENSNKDKGLESDNNIINQISKYILSKDQLNLLNESKNYYITKSEILKDLDLSLNEDIIVLDQPNIDIHITEYCPKLFRKILKIDEISEDYIIKVLQPKNSSTNLIQTFDKNSFYINSSNKEFLIKGITLDELNFFRSNIITSLYQYLKLNKNSLILRIEGLYDITLDESSKNKKQYFALMLNTYESLSLYTKEEYFNNSFSLKNNNIDKINTKKGIKLHKLNETKFNKCLYVNSPSGLKAQNYSIDLGHQKSHIEENYKIYLDEKEYNRLKNITKKDIKYLKKIGVLNYYYFVAEIPMDENEINKIFIDEKGGGNKKENEIKHIKKYLFKSNNKKNIIYSISIVDYYKDPIKI